MAFDPFEIPGFLVLEGREIGDAGGICSNRKDCEKVTGAEVVPSLLITGRTKYRGGGVFGSHLL